MTVAWVEPQDLAVSVIRMSVVIFTENLCVAISAQDLRPAQVSKSSPVEPLNLHTQMLVLN